MIPDLEQPEIDFLILADRAEAVAGKLYMIGGALDRLNVPSFEHGVALSLAIGVIVPWARANGEHTLRVRIENDDGNPIGPAIEAKINVGRPAGSIQGQSFRATIAINGAFVFPRAGSYRAIASIDDASTRRVVFHAIAQRPPGQA